MNEVQLPNGRIRRYRSKEEVAALVAEFRASGSTPREFAQLKGINLNVLRRWLEKDQQAQNGGSQEGAPQFREVQLPVGSCSWVAEVGLVSGVSLKFAADAPAPLVEKLFELAGR